MSAAPDFGLHALLDPGASLVIALGAHGVGAAGAADRAHESMARMGGDSWRLADDWARRERAEGVLARALSSVAPMGREGEAAHSERWARLGMVADFRQARLHAALSDALDTLGSAGIPPLLLKGAAMACTRYPDGFADRPMEDMDLLVPPDAAEDAYRMLVQDGWRTGGGTGEANGPGHHHLSALKHPESGHVLEIHRSILPRNAPFGWNDADVWRSASELSMQRSGLEAARNVRAMVPAGEELLLHAAVHLSWAHELRVGLWGWIRDLAVLAPSVSWPRVVELARDRGAASAVYWALRLGLELGGGAAVDAEGCEALRPVSRPRARLLVRHYVLGAVPPRAVPGGVALSRLGWALGVAPRGSGVGASRPWLPLGAAGRGVDGVEVAGEVGGSPRARGRGRGRGGRWDTALIRELRGLPLWVRWIARVVGR